MWPYSGFRVSGIFPGSCRCHRSLADWLGFSGAQASKITPVAAWYWARDGFPRLGTVLGSVEHGVPLLASQAMTTSCRIPLRSKKPYVIVFSTLRQTPNSTALSSLGFRVLKNVPSSLGCTGSGLRVVCIKLGVGGLHKLEEPKCSGI